MALPILVYHSAVFADLGWQTDASSVLGRLGIYGVSIFFVLSGLSMAHVYHAAMSDAQAVKRFWVRRAFRILPLMALVVGAMAAMAVARGSPYSLWDVFINATGLFGFISPSNYIPVGAWSIGNEMVFYAITPALLFAYAASARVGDVITLATVAIAVVFAFYLLVPDIALADQWDLYVNPFNNIFLYCAGVAMFYHFSEWKPSKLWRLAIIISPIVVFTLWPATGNQVSIVTGVGRVGFSLIAVLAVLSFYRAALSLPLWLATPLEWLGKKISYGVYLIHPFAISIVRRLPGGIIDYPTVFVLCVALITIAVSFVVYFLLEMPMMRLGKGLTSARVSPAASA